MCDYQSERHCSKTGYGGYQVFCCAITSQNGTAPKHNDMTDELELGAITSQNGTAPKHRLRWLGFFAVRLPVRTALLQNPVGHIAALVGVRLPVRTALLQNLEATIRLVDGVRLPVRTALLQNWNLYSPTYGFVRLPVRTALLQNVHGRRGKDGRVRLPVRTALLQNEGADLPIIHTCDYQSERHCSKTSQAGW